MWSKARRMPADSTVVRFPWLGDGEMAAPDSRTRNLKTTSDLSDDELELRERIEALEHEAFTKGYAQGEREGQAAVAKKAEALIARLSGTIDDVAALRAGMLHKTERDVVRMALAIAERILSRQLTVDPELLLAMARVAIDRLGDGIAATIHLHPDDHRMMTAVRAKRPDAVPSAVAIEPDLTVPRGGCIVRSEFGVIDLGIEAQVSELSRALLGDGSASSAQALTDGRVGSH